MGTNDQLETSQRDFIQNYANRDYCFYRAIRERCRDAVSGSARIKAIGGDYTSAYKYLYPSRQQKKNGEEYKRYLNMAVWYGYARIAARVGCGLIGVGEPTVANLPKQIEPMVYYATPFRDGLKALQMRLNLSQFVDGQRIMALELNSPERVRQDNLPVFYINSYQANKFLRVKFDFSDGQSFARFVLMDESDYEFDYFSKREIAVEKYRVFGLDGNDEYYQAAITRDQWQNFDLFSPPIAADSRNPQFGEAIYPELNGIRFNRIPITWCNVSSLSGASYEEPVLTDVADLDIELFNADAAYRQTLWLTSQPTPVINGELTESEKAISDWEPADSFISTIAAEICILLNFPVPAPALSDRRSRISANGRIADDVALFGRRKPVRRSVENHSGLPGRTSGFDGANQRKCDYPAVALCCRVAAASC